jgi:hypothetical protein
MYKEIGRVQTIFKVSRSLVFVSDVESSRIANLVLVNPSDFGLAKGQVRTTIWSEVWIRTEESQGCRSIELSWVLYTYVTSRMN